MGAFVTKLTPAAFCMPALRGLEVALHPRVLSSRRILLGIFFHHVLEHELDLAERWKLSNDFADRAARGIGFTTGGNA